jgi:type II secretory ATPase GspE/PulE/Tfp pilus assembly ATPase PilB-like protein/ActR/RegA family two-component response regulator
MANRQAGASAQAENTWSDPWIEAALIGMGVSAAALQSLRGRGAASLWHGCVESGLVTNEGLLAAYSRQFGVPIADMNSAPTDAKRLLPEAVARKLGVVPLRQDGRTLVAACTRPLDMNLETSVGFASGLRPRLLLTDPDTLKHALEAAYPRSDEARDLVGSVGPLQDGDGLLREIAGMDDGAIRSVSTTDLVNALLIKAIRQRASDVHIQPHEGSIAIRYRIDGAMLEVARLPRALISPITSRLKILANLDIADRMRPQDGRAQVQIAGRRVDLRISTLPVGTMGEKTVVRILDSGGAPLTLTSLGFLDAEMRRVEQLFRTSDGLVLVTGPTGSGKTTTLYSALRLVQATGANIVTVEDPIEYRLDGVAQAQVNEKAGLTFATVLRSILRQDPDAVLVGEIRDHETAEVALQASMTGHLVLSTLHTNDSASTIMRLADMGVDLTVLATSLRGVMAQRLVRRVCHECRVPCDIGSLAVAQQALLEHLPNPTLYQAVGCPACQGTGYYGRLVVPEIAVITPDLEHAITQRAELSTVVELCRRNGTIPLWDAGLQRVALGLTTLNELLDNITPPAVDAPAAPRQQQSDVDAIFQSAALPAAAPPAGTMEVVARAHDRAHGGGVPAQSAGVRVQSADVLTQRDGVQRLRPRLTRVLVVDEDAAARAALRLALEAVGFTVNEAADGEAALEFVKRLKPDMMLLELALPRVDGIAVLRAMQAMESCCTTPLVVTVESDPEIAVWAMELGAADVITKPVGPDVLAHRLLSLMADAAA